MIVVRTNLHVERAQLGRKIRPRLLVAIALGVLALGRFVSDYGESRNVDALRAQLNASRSLRESSLGSLQRAREADAELSRAGQRRDFVLSVAGRRRNWAPIRAQALSAAPPSAEFTSFHVDAEQPENPSIKITGKCAGVAPRLEADKCMLQISNAFATARIPLFGRIVSLEEVRSPLIGDIRNEAAVDFVLHFTTEAPARAN